MAATVRLSSFNRIKGFDGLGVVVHHHGLFKVLPVRYR